MPVVSYHLGLWSYSNAFSWKAECRPIEINNLYCGYVNLSVELFFIHGVGFLKHCYLKSVIKIRNNPV